jgi:hypothetical protein
MTGRNDAGSEEPIHGQCAPTHGILDHDIGPVQDLTRRAQLFSPGAPGLFDGEETYAEVFEALARAIFRQAVHVALVCAVFHNPGQSGS